MKVLIVEDNFDSRDCLGFFLGLQDYEIIEAEDGEEGFYKALSEKPLVILTDISMPKMDGIELINLLRKQPDFQDIKIIALTGNGGSFASAAKHAGADVVLQKPV